MMRLAWAFVDLHTFSSTNKPFQPPAARPCGPGTAHFSLVSALVNRTKGALLWHVASAQPCDVSLDPYEIP